MDRSPHTSGASLADVTQILLTKEKPTRLLFLGEIYHGIINNEYH